MSEQAKYLRRAEAADYVRQHWGFPCSHAHLHKLSSVGGGPVFRRAGRWPMYLKADLDEWVMAKMGEKDERDGNDKWPENAYAKITIEAYGGQEIIYMCGERLSPLPTRWQQDGRLLEQALDKLSDRANSKG